MLHKSGSKASALKHKSAFSDDADGPGIIDEEGKHRIMQERSKIIKRISEFGLKSPPSPTSAFTRYIEIEEI